MSRPKPSSPNTGLSAIGPCPWLGVGWAFIYVRRLLNVLASNISPSSIIFIPIIKDALFKAQSFNRLLVKHIPNMNELIELISYLIGSWETNLFEKLEGKRASRVGGKGWDLKTLRTVFKAHLESHPPLCPQLSLVQFIWEGDSWSWASIGWASEESLPPFSSFTCKLSLRWSHDFFEFLSLHILHLLPTLIPGFTSQRKKGWCSLLLGNTPETHSKGEERGARKG